MTANEIPIKSVPHLMIQVVLDTEPIPGYPEFDGEPLTLLRLQDKTSWETNGRRKKARRVWDRFAGQVNEVMGRRNEKIIKLLLSRGVDVELPPLEEWAPDLVALDVSPDDPVMVKLLYVHELIPEPMDKIELLTRIMVASGLETGLLDSVRGLFEEAAAGLRAQAQGNGSEPGPDLTADGGLEQLDQAIDKTLQSS